jgi:hypothetical protein
MYRAARGGNTVRMTITFLSLGLMALLVGCSSSEKVNSDSSSAPSKYDAPLRLQLLSGGSEEIVYVLGKCRQPITHEMRNTLAAKGLVVYSTIGDAFSASGSVQSIEEIAELPFVMQLQLSAKAYPR